MKLLRVDRANPQPELIEEAAAVVRAGGLVAFPTETVYGIGANALDAEAVTRIFAAKGRPSFNPLIAHVASADAARALSARWPELAERAAAAFWPGPLTLVVPRGPEIPDVVTAGLETVALRVPAHPVALALLGASGLPIAAPSANRSTEVSPTTAAHVAKGLGDRVDLVLDAGPTEVGIESTVLDLSGGVPVLLRPGSIALPALERVLGPIRRIAGATDESARPSPGMMERHYSPRAELHLFHPDEREQMERTVARARAGGLKVGGLLLHRQPPDLDHPVHMPGEAREYAKRLYAMLHEMDEAGCDLIVADAVPEDAAWDGVRDRLTRAARHP